MSYSTKYSFSYTDVFGISSVVNLKLLGYAGAVNNLTLGGINYEFGRDRGEGVIRGTSASIGLWSLTQAQFSEFRSINDKQWLVEHIKGEQPYWYGWLTPEIFSEPFKKSVPYRIELSAMDGLGDLSNIDYLDNSGNLLITRESFKTIIGRCLNAAQLGINMVFSSAIHPTGMSGDIFTQCTYSNVALRDKDGLAIKCSEVLERFKTLGITIKQWRAKWYIIRTSDLISNIHVYEYTSSGTYVGDAVVDLDWTIDDTATEGAINLPLAESGTQSNVQAYKEKEINIDYGKKSSFLYNFDFSLDKSGWTESVPGYASVYETTDDKYLLLNGYTHYSSEINVSQSVSVKATTDDFSFGFKVGTFGRILSGGANHGINLDYKIKVSLIGTSQTYYLNQTSGWTTTPGYITGTLLSSPYANTPAWNDLSVLTSGIPIDGTLLVQLIRPPVTTTPPTGTFILGVGFTELVLNHPVDTYISSTTLKCVNNSSFNFIPSKEDIFINDCPAVINANLIYANFVGDASGVPTTTWSIIGITGAYPLAEYYLREQISLHRIPQKKLSVTIRGIFDWCGTVTDRDGVKYEIVSGTLNERDQAWDLELNEILSYSGGATITNAPRIYNASTSSNRTVNGANDYRTIGGIGSPKRISDLAHTTALALTSKIEIERPGSTESEYALVSDLYSIIVAAYMGIANGLATLNSSGIIPSSQLPSYVDDVLDFATFSAFPGTGETGKIYIADDTNISYRWSGSSYIQITSTDHTHANKSTLDMITYAMFTAWNDAVTNEHWHSNKTIIDGITATLISAWNQAVTDDHTHSNKAVLDGITAALITNWNSAVTSNHTHSNKTVLDGITAILITAWNQAVTDLSEATASNTASKIIKRDSNGGFASGNQIVQAVSKTEGVFTSVQEVFQIKNTEGDTKWYITISASNELQFRNATGVVEAILDQTGNLKAKGEVTAYGL